MEKQAFAICVKMGAIWAARQCHKAAGARCLGFARRTFKLKSDRKISSASRVMEAGCGAGAFCVAGKSKRSQQKSCSSCNSLAGLSSSP